MQCLCLTGPGPVEPPPRLVVACPRSATFNVTSSLRSGSAACFQHAHLRRALLRPRRAGWVLSWSHTAALWRSLELCQNVCAACIFLVPSPSQSFPPLAVSGSARVPPVVLLLVGACMLHSALCVSLLDASAWVRAVFCRSDTMVLGVACLGLGTSLGISSRLGVLRVGRQGAPGLAKQRSFETQPGSVRSVPGAPAASHSVRTLRRAPRARALGRGAIGPERWAMGALPECEDSWRLFWLIFAHLELALASKHAWVSWLLRACSRALSKETNQSKS